jgi:hypothetical protein|tara:strand:+ start:5964 stop:6143 length:180 start_codon:yes stop_codon:yes gene_type:complete
MAYQVTIVPATSGQPDGRYTEAYLADFINTTVVPTSGAVLTQILENRGSNLILVWDDSL